MSETSKHKDAGVLIRLAYQGMCKLGIDADKVIEGLGINKEQLYDSQLRTSHAGQALFWKLTEDVSQDADIGLHLGAYIPLFKGQIIEYLFYSSASFGDGLKRSLNYQRLLSDAVQFRLIDNESETYLAFDFPGSNLRHLMESTCVVMNNFLTTASEDTFKPICVHFSHSGDVDNKDYQRIIGCEVLFEQNENRIYFNRSALSHRLLHTQPELLNLHEQLASQQLANLELQDLITKVREQIASLLETGEVNLESVAKQLDINPRTLRSQLTEAGTSFSQVLNDYRHYLAKKLLVKTNESIAEIVYLTAFSEPSTFYRAFKRWEGVTPVEYRKMNQNGSYSATHN